MIDDAELELLAEAGLRYSTDAEPGITRKGAGRGFTYRKPDGSRVTDEHVLARIRALVIPPAWTDVWICRTGNGHVQATGRDARGRKQYRYHDEWRRMRDEVKYGDLATFGEALPDLRRTVEDDLGRRAMPREKVVALVIALLDRTLIRVGNESYRRENGTFGLTTMLRKHVDLEGTTVRFQYRGKGGLDHDVQLTDRRLAAAVRRCHELGGREVFTYTGDDGHQHRVDSSDCNAYLRSVVGESTTVKTFRTWGGTSAALEHLVHEEGEPSARAMLDAVDAAADRLGNTRAVARRSYIHPVVEASYFDGRLDEAWDASRRTETMTRPERALLRLLDDERP